MKTIFGFVVGFGALFIMASILEKYNKHYGMEFEFDEECIGDLTSWREDK